MSLAILVSASVIIGLSIGALVYAACTSQPSTPKEVKNGNRSLALQLLQACCAIALVVLSALLLGQHAYDRKDIISCIVLAVNTKAQSFVNKPNDNPSRHTLVLYALARSGL